MNSKTAKLLRNYCKIASREYPLMKKVYQNISKKEQEKFKMFMTILVNAQEFEKIVEADKKTLTKKSI